MIKFTMGKVVGLGLSRRNCEKLLDKQPIRVALKDLNLDTDIEILLLAGETEQQIASDLREFIGPQTKVHSEDKPQ